MSRDLKFPIIKNIIKNSHKNNTMSATIKSTHIDIITKSITNEEENNLNIKWKNASLPSTLGHSSSKSPYCKCRTNTQCPLEGKYVLQT